MALHCLELCAQLVKNLKNLLIMSLNSLDSVELALSPTQLSVVCLDSIFDFEKFTGSCVEMFLRSILLSVKQEYAI